MIAIVPSSSRVFPHGAVLRAAPRATRTGRRRRCPRADVARRPLRCRASRATAAAELNLTMCCTTRTFCRSARRRALHEPARRRRGRAGRRRRTRPRCTRRGSPSSARSRWGRSARRPRASRYVLEPTAPMARATAGEARSERAPSSSMEGVLELWPAGRLRASCAISPVSLVPPPPPPPTRITNNCRFPARPRERNARLFATLHKHRAGLSGAVERARRQPRRRAAAAAAAASTRAHAGGTRRARPRAGARGPRARGSPPSHHETHAGLHALSSMPVHMTGADASSSAIVAARARGRARAPPTRAAAGVGRPPARSTAGSGRRA